MTCGDNVSGFTLQVSGVGYNGKGTVCLLPSKEVIKEFSNVSVGKLVEVSVKAPLWKYAFKRSWWDPL